MAGRDDDSTGFQTSSEESLRQAEAAFGGAATDGPTGVPGSDDARRRRIRRVVFAFVVLVALAAAAGAVALVVSALDTGDSSKPKVTIPGLPAIPELPSVPQQPATPAPRSASPADNFSVTGLARSRATARRLAGPASRIEVARVTADQLQVIARAGSQRKVVIVSPGFTRAITTGGGASTGLEFAWSGFDPRVPSRLARMVRSRYGVGPARIDYMLATRNPIEARVGWLVYPRGGAFHFEADVRGRSLRRVG